MHADELSKGMLLYEIYLAKDQIMEFVHRRIRGSEGVYIGYESVAARFAFTFVIVSSSNSLDDVQLTYFALITERFLAEAVRSQGIVFNVEPDDQARTANRRLGRSLADLEGGNTTNEKNGSSQNLKLEGIIRGGVPGSTQKDEFRFALMAAFNSGDKVYLSMLTEGAYLPGELDDEGHVFFENIAGVSAQFTTLEEPGEVNKVSSKSHTGAIIGGVIASIALLLAANYLRRYRKEQKKHKLEAEKYRKQMKEERRARRLIKSSSRLSDEWGDDDDYDYQPPKEPGLEMPLPTQFSSTTSSSDSQTTAPSPPPVCCD